MKWKNRRIVAFDTETTGLSPFLDDRVIEFAAVVFQLDESGGIARTTEHAWLINPGIPIPRTVTQITGITNDDVQDKPPFTEYAEQIRDLFVDSVAVAHNFPFDLAFLKKELVMAGIAWREPLAAVDTIDVSMRVYKEVRGHKLSDLCKRLDITLDGAHRAVNDAEATGKCFIELVRRHEVEDELQSMLDWARAIGRPPPGGPLGVDGNGAVVFATGKHQGEYAEEYPLYLAWMEKARERHDGQWRWRFPESTRSWIRRWLDVRGSGRSRGNSKGFRIDDWALDSCIAERRVRP